MNEVNHGAMPLDANPNEEAFIPEVDNIDLTPPAPEQRTPKGALRAATDWLVQPSHSSVLLVGIVLVAALLRVIGFDWDQGHGIHPDERFLRMVASDIRWPASISEYFNSAISPLNPRNKQYTFWVYGELPLFLVHRLGSLIDKAGYGDIHLVGRLTSALVDVLSVVVIYYLGKRLYSRKVGLLAAGLLAFTALNIQLSHFFAVDTFAAFFATLGLFLAVLAADEGRWWHFPLLGVAVGAAMASKISMAQFGAVAGLAWLIYTARSRQKEAWVERSLLRLGLLAVGVVVTFRVLQPYAFTGPGFLNFSLSPDFLANMKEAQTYQTGEADPPWGFQWADRTAYLFPLYNIVLFGMGVPMALAAWGGWAVAGWQMLAKKKAVHLLPWAWVAVLMVYQGGQFVKSMRYFVPIYPALALFAGFMLVWLYEQAKKRARRAQFAAAAIGALVVLSTAIYGIAFAGIYVRPHPRIAATDWIYENVPMAATLHYKTADGTVRHHQLGIPHGQQMAPGMPPVNVSFWLPEGGEIIDITINRLRSDGASAAPTTVHVAIAREMSAQDELSSAELTGSFPAAADGRGLPYRFEMHGLHMAKGVRYLAQFSVKEGDTLVAESSTILQETYDDPKVPFSMVGRDPFRNYNIPELRVYDDESPDKLRHFQELLTQADYFALTSQRGYGSIPRMGARFPMATKFYDLLFAEQMGFRLVGEFTSYPTFAGIVFNDDNAEEAFTVYDHAKVLVFQKVEPLSAERIAQLIEPPDWNNIPRFTARDASKYGQTLLLDASDRAIQQRGGTWSDIFDMRSIINRIPTLIWLLFVELLGLVAFPLCFGLFRNFGDRGYAFAKTFGVLLLVFVTWIAVSLKLVYFTRLTIGLALLVLAAISAAIAWRRRDEIVAFVRSRWHLLAATEALFLALFFVFWLIRSGNPDIWHPYMGGEKPMDFAYLNAVIKSTTFPPYDPWFAGGYLNYYYWGQIIVGTLLKFTGILPWVGYNLVLPLLFALTGIGAFSVTHQLLPQSVRGESGTHMRGWLFGLLGVVFVLFLGNLGELVLIVGGLIQVGAQTFQSSVPLLGSIAQAIIGLVKVLGGAELPFRTEWWYWNATRTIPETINEFPFFTFLYADLHAHMIALPFTLLALGLAVNVVKGANGTRDRIVRALGDAPLSRLGAWLREWDAGMILALSLVLGALWPTNTWDFPTYLVIGAGAFFLRGYVRHGRLAWGWVLRVGVQTVAMFGLATALFYPFHANYGSYYTSVELWKGRRTQILQFLVVGGVWLFISLSYLLSRAFGNQRSGILGSVGGLLAGRARRQRFLHLARVLSPSFDTWWTGGLAGVAVLALTVAVLLYMKYTLVAVLLPFLVVGLVLLFRPRLAIEERFVVLMIVAGLALTMGVEIVVLKGDIGRMNTVFKFYLQVWVLWGAASAVALAHMAERIRGWSKGWRRGWLVVTALLIVSAALYPIFSTNAKVADRFDAKMGPSLDGIAYMDTAQYWENDRQMDLKWDKSAILWMLENVEGSRVVLEANGPLYHWTSRVSIYTGLPTVIGWDWHQKQQRMLMPGGTVERRIEDVRTLYTTFDEGTAFDLLRKYDVAYIYVGQQEKAVYGEAGMAKFDQWASQGKLEVVFSNPEVKIYRVVGL